MLEKTIKYTDYNGTERTEKFYFNLTKAELIEMELSTEGGMQQLISTIIDKRDVPKMMQIFKEIILKSYGEKSADGKRFVKSPELSQGFLQTEAYSELFMELCTDSDAAGAFINGIIPNEIVKQIDKPSSLQILADA